MEFFAELSLVAISLALVAYVVLDYVRGNSELLSIRNVAIGGFVLFQTASAALWLIDDNYNVKYFLLDPGMVGVKFAFACIVFIVAALVVYNTGPGAKQLAGLVPKPKIVPTDTAMWATAIVLAISAGVFRFAVFIPYVNILAEMMGTAVAGTSAGLVGWLIGRNLLNPIVWLFAIALITVNLAIALTGEFGRRTIVTVGLGVAFGLYYGRLRYERPGKTVALLVASIIPLVIFLAAYSSIRGGENRRASFAQFVTAMISGGSIKDGLRDIDGQGTGGVSMWLMEHFGPNGQRQTEDLRAFRYFILFPLPRAYFPFKPEPLSLDIPRYANTQFVTQGSLTIGPGIIGHAFADGGWWVVVFYAGVGGLIIRFSDEIIRRSPHAPFVVLPMGSMLGEIMGVPRGESSAMMFKFVFGTVSCYVFVAAIGKMLEYIGYAERGDADARAFEAGDGDDDDDPYADYADYGEDYGEDEFGEDDAERDGTAA